MKTIYKQFIPIDNDPHTFLFAGPVLHVGYQGPGDDLVFWHEAGIQPGAHRMFQVFGTGHNIPHSAKYCGTVQVGMFVWHLYEVFAAC